METWELLAIAIGLAMDAFAVSLAAAAAGHAGQARPAFRLAFHFGLFQFLMPVLGWYAGRHLVELIAVLDHWIAFALLAFVASRMLHSAWSGEHGSQSTDPSRGIALVGLAVATSIDALAVGFSLAVLRVAIWYPSAVIGVITAFLSLVGIALGRRLGSLFGRVAEIAGGLLLLAIGIRILVVHMS